MSEINWDLAPEDAETLEQNVNIITWRKKGYFWLAMDGWKEDFFSTEWTVVATRPTEKKKTVADKQEGEKWTHYTEKGYKCKISLSEPDSYGSIVILSEHNVYIRCYPEDINPIKPKLTKAEAWDKVEHMYLYDGYSFHGAHEFVVNNYEVTDE